jgi:alpha-galactosidase
MCGDLEIPQRYGIFQSVGDTVGPGGLARELRNIPFAVAVAREMEHLCPSAWLLNLTNPMTTICRAVTQATGVPTIGLCHEITGARHYLAGMFDVPIETISFKVAGINHLPILLDWSIDGQDGAAILRSWLAEHGPFALMDQHDPDPLRNIFRDRLAVKLSLFEQLGVLFGAGDRHVAEFFPGFLTEASEHGRRYGVQLTTIAQREELARQKRSRIEDFVAGKAPPRELRKSEEQLTEVIAALSGGPDGYFIVNIPNHGQVDNLPREAVVECIAHIGPLGVQPWAVGALPYPAYAVIAPHIARQELIVEAALTSQRQPAQAALASDPLVPNLAVVEPMLTELLAANERFTR